jgi:hypothetical protein
LVVPSVAVPPWPAGTRQLPLATCGGALLAVQSLSNGRSHVWGTAFLIAPGLAVTAAHVVRAYEDCGHFRGDAGALMALGLAEPISQIWYVDHIYIGDTGDLAILRLTYGAKLPPRLTLTPLEMSAVMPSVGDVVTTMGFASAEESTAFDVEAGEIEGGGTSLLVSVGRVIDVYRFGRDRVMAPRACFAAEVESVGAMSGGPVLNADGRVIGFITSSIEPTSTALGVTLFSMIYDALLAEVQPTWPVGYWPPKGGLVKDLIEAEQSWRVVRDAARGVWDYLGGADPDDEGASA